MPHLDVADSVLVIIDAQPGFYGAQRRDVDRAMHASTLARAAWVAGVAAALEVPIVITEEDATRNGPTDPAILTAAPFKPGIVGAQSSLKLLTPPDF